MGIEALIHAFPVTTIESEPLAFLGGLLRKDLNNDRKAEITFLEPPAGQHVPFVDPVEALMILFRANGMSFDDATARAVHEFATLRAGLSVLERPRLYHGSEVLNIPECISIPRLLALLKEHALVSDELIKFIEHACNETCMSKLYEDLSSSNGEKWRLDELPDTPLPKSMIEFFVGSRSDIAWEIAPEGPVDEELPPALLSWRESMMPVAKHLEQVLGEEVFYFQDLDDYRDDDWCHRNFVLHCWCDLLPESDFVQYMLEVAEMPDVEFLKSALLAPESFRLHPFKFECHFGGIEATILRFSMDDATK